MSIKFSHKVAIIMGEGDVLTGIATNSDGVGAYSFLQAADKHEPGTKVPNLDGKYSAGEFDVNILFLDVAALDRFTADLAKLRTKMVEGGGGSVSLPENAIHTINARMHPDQCPTAGSLGECCVISEIMPGRFESVLYIWDDEFNDSAAVAGWFRDIGADNVTVCQTLYSDDNGDRDGKTTDGSREWTVFFSMAGGAA